MCNLFDNKKAKRWLDRSEETKPKPAEEPKKSFKDIIKQAMEGEQDLLPKDLMEKLQAYIEEQDEDPKTQDESSDN